MNRPPCCWMIGWYAERPCRSLTPTSAISLASGALPGTVCAVLGPLLHSSTTEQARHRTMVLNHGVILTPSVVQEAAYLPSLIKSATRSPIIMVVAFVLA